MGKIQSVDTISKRSGNEGACLRDDWTTVSSQLRSAVNWEASISSRFWNPKDYRRSTYADHDFDPAEDMSVGALENQ